MQQIFNYINGKLVSAQSGNTIEVYDPSRGVIYTHAPDSDERDINTAVEAAQLAFPLWSTLHYNQRSQFLEKIAQRIEEKLDALAAAESLDNGKPYWLAKKVDIPRAASNFRFFSHAITQWKTEMHSMGSQGFNHTVRSPLGVVGCISPWNLPLYLFSWKIAPALAVGNTVVAKPSEITPYTAFLLSEICMEVGLPAGVLNIVHGLGEKVGKPLVDHQKVKAISFTGSTAVGKRIAIATAPVFKKVSLEMGGKNPNVIFADCNYEKMLKTTVQSSFSNQGQICLCGSRIFVEKSIYEQFKQDFVEKVSALKVGPPTEDKTKIGAVVSKPHFEKILSYIELAKKEGGTILCGGKRAKLDDPYQNGWYIEPTIIEGLSYDCRVNQEEIFGPVVTIMPFETEEEVLRYANSTTYGLSATLWTENLTRAHRMAGLLESGIVWVNTWLLRDLRTPFGGMKSSGIGREGGEDALRFFTEPKNVCIEIE